MTPKSRLTAIAFATSESVDLTDVLPKKARLLIYGNSLIYKQKPYENGTNTYI